MPDKLFTLLSSVPFLMTTCEDGKPQLKANIPRIIEALVIAVVSGALSGYISLQKIEVKVDLLLKQVDKVETRLDDHISKPR